MFTLEALEAKEGDCLILHYGPADAPKRILIDGGPSGVFKQTLRKRLVQLREEGSADLQMVMVSHIDADHIAGILDFFKELKKQRDDGEEPLARVATLWFNSFDDVVGNDSDELIARFETAAQTAAAGDRVSADSPVSQAGALILAGVGQGRKLRDLASALGTVVNAGFDNMILASVSGDAPRRIKLDDHLTFTVLGPTKTQLVELREKWDQELAKIKSSSPARASAIAAAFLDTSAANLSSTVVLAECEGKRMLLTGDARGDFILEGLNEANLLENGGIHVDLMKVPHHGSDRNVSTEFFRQVTADHYVISANGKHHNPDKAMLEMLRQARQGESYTVHFTNEVEQVSEYVERGAAEGYNTVVRAENELGLAIVL